MTASLMLVGCGKMGGAMLAGWLDRGTRPEDVVVIEPHAPAAEAVRASFGVEVVADVTGLPDGTAPDVIVFAVKPQTLPDMIDSYAGLAKGAVSLSIAAGKPIAFFEDALGTECAVVRTMPNTPAAVGRGITAACANDAVSDGQRIICQTLLEAVGEAVWVDDEGLMDAVTAVSGSGPAYVFWLIECLAAAGVDAGLPPDIAEKLARATVSGSGELARQAAEGADVLRRNVTSPGGTTAAALEVLMAEDGLKPLMSRAIKAAADRSRELAG